MGADRTHEKWHEYQAVCRGRRKGPPAQLLYDGRSDQRLHWRDICWNCLASNPLLECLVFGEAAANPIHAHWDEPPLPPPIRAWGESRVTDSDEEVILVP